MTQAMVAAASKSSFIAVLMALIAIQLGFGGYPVTVEKFAKKANVNPLIFGLIRDGGGFPVLFLAAYIAERKVLWPVKRDWFLLISCGFIGICMGQLMFLIGVYYTSPDVAAMLQPLVPVWTLVIAILLRIEPMPKINTKVGAAKIVGILLAVSGAVIMNFGKSSLSSNAVNSKYSTGGSLLGYLALILNTLSLAVYVLLQKRYVFNTTSSRWKEHPIGLTAWSYLFGFLFLAIASLYYVKDPEEFYIRSSEAVYSFIYAIFIASALCYMLITWCNMLVSSTLVTTSWPLQVFFCVIISYLVSGETLNVKESVGGSLIIVAMLFVVWSNYHTEVASRDTLCNDERINSSYEKIESSPDLP